MSNPLASSFKMGVVAAEQPAQGTVIPVVKLESLFQVTNPDGCAGACCEDSKKLDTGAKLGGLKS